MTIVRQYGASRTLLIETAPHIELTQQSIALAKDVHNQLEALLGEPSYVVLARTRIRKRTSEREEWGPVSGPQVGMGGNPISTIDAVHKRRLQLIDGVPLVVIADTFVGKVSEFGIIIDVDEKTGKLIEIAKLG